LLKAHLPQRGGRNTQTNTNFPPQDPPPTTATVQQKEPVFVFENNHLEPLVNRIAEQMVSQIANKIIIKVSDSIVTNVMERLTPLITKQITEMQESQIDIPDLLKQISEQIISSKPEKLDISQLAAQIQLPSLPPQQIDTDNILEQIAETIKKEIPTQSPTITPELDVEDLILQIKSLIPDPAPIPDFAPLNQIVQGIEALKQKVTLIESKTTAAAPPFKLRITKKTKRIFKEIKKRLHR